MSKIKISKLKMHRTLVFCLCLYECETWSVLLREKRRLRVFENSVLRNMFGRKRNEVTRGWRGMHGNEVRDLYSSPKIIRVVKSKGMRLAVHVERIAGGELYTGFWWGS